MAILAAVRDSNTLETDLPKFISIPVSVLHVLKISSKHESILYDVLNWRFFCDFFSEFDNKFDEERTFLKVKKKEIVHSL